MDNSIYFTNLNFPKLQIITRRWIDQYPDVPIARIVLYPYSSKYEKYFKGTLNTMYAIVFELDEISQKEPNKQGEKLEKKSTNENRDSRKIIYGLTPIESFVADTEYVSPCNKRVPFKAFINADFKNVYKAPPSKDDFRYDWIFIPKFKNEQLPAGIMTCEPHIVLFDIEEPDKPLIKTLEGIPKSPKTEILEYAEKMWAAGTPLRTADFNMDNLGDKIIERIARDHNVAMDTLRKYVSDKNLLAPTRPGRKPGGGLTLKK